MMPAEEIKNMTDAYLQQICSSKFTVEGATIQDGKFTRVKLVMGKGQAIATVQINLEYPKETI